jgi:sugar lactone lactonase YvrE
MSLLIRFASIFEENEGLTKMKVRKIHTKPPLFNVNGGTYYNGKVYVLTNGGTVRGLYHLNITTGEAECILNNFRGRHLNSPNDLVFDMEGNILFTEYVSLKRAALSTNCYPN